VVTKHTRHSRALAVLAILFSALLLLPSAAFAQATPGATPAGTPAATPQPTAAAQPQLTLSSSKDSAGSTLTVNGTGFGSSETVDVSFNGSGVGTPATNSGGQWSLSFTVPSVPTGTYGVAATGRTSGKSASTTFEVIEGAATVTFSVPQAAPGTAISIMGSGFTPGEQVAITFNGAAVGTLTADTQGNVTTPFTIPTLAAGQYVAEATGQTSGSTAHANFNVLAGPAPAATAAPTAAPAPAATPAPVPAGSVPQAPALAHDDRYFSQTGYRIDDDNVWAFFQQYGGLSTFGYPVSRMFTFLGCPVQMFQRQIIQVCQGQSPALINMLDPEIFPYTQVNGSTFPSPDPTMKANTPSVTDPDYSTKIVDFVNANVPDTWNGQPVNFLQTFNSLGGLTIWGAPISNPAPDPANGGFIYQRFQRGIMHYIAGQGTQSILLADYLKAIMMNQNVPADLLAQSRESRYFNQYAPGQTLWLARPQDLPGTDLTFAFVQG
jgi:IPT/TIG domain-containing protein